MKKTKKIHKALRRRGYITSEIIGIKNHLERLSETLRKLENEKKLLDTELENWDKFKDGNNL